MNIFSGMFQKILSVLNLQQQLKFNTYFFYKYSLEIFEFDEHAQSGQWGSPFSDLPALKFKHITLKGSLFSITTDQTALIAH